MSITRILPHLVILLLWAGVYLPTLGTLELKGEEGRRIQPGIAMLESGDWMVPQVGGEDYFRKPPLVNWAVAGSVTFFGKKNEWTVRFPSVVCVLMLGLAVLWAATPLLGSGGALMAAVFTLTNISMMEKGRLIEIEALYIALTGIAFMLWLRCWHAGRPLAGWAAAGVFLGLGMLAKGPVHLIFFYLPVVCLLHGTRGRRHGGWRQLLTPGHALSLALTFGIFAIWAIPFYRMTSEAGDAEVAGAWTEQLMGRLRGDDFEFGKYWENVFRSGLVNFIPWSAFFPLVWHQSLVEGMEEGGRRMYKSLRLGLLVSWAVVAFIPGSVPRYTLPLLTLAALLVAWACVEWDRRNRPVWFAMVWKRVVCAVAGICIVGALAVPFVAGWGAGRVAGAGALAFGAAVALTLAMRLRRPVSLALVSGLCMVLLTGVYSLAIVPKIRETDRLEADAGRVADVLPPGETLYLFDPGFQPVQFYLPRPLDTVHSTSDLDRPEIRYLLVRERHLEKVRRRNPWRDAIVAAEIPDKDDKPYLLLRAE